MILFGLEEFAARRRRAQTDIIEALRAVVSRALDGRENTDGYREVMEVVRRLWATAYAQDAGVARAMPSTLADQIIRTLRQTDKTSTDESQPTTVSTWLATVILSTATEEAAKDDPEELFLEWVSLEDDAVRPSHKEANGQVRPIGEKFDVGGVKMSRPGDLSAPIEEWINCRCVPRPVLASEALVAGGWGAPSETDRTLREVSPAERKKDAKEGRALPDGSFPIDNCSDLRNAIQAIGRAKDPAKAKAHIRKRKNALGCPDVELPDTWALETFVPEEGDGIPAMPGEDSRSEVDEEPPEEPTHAGLAVQAADTKRILMLQRSLDQDDPPEVRGTWEFPGGTIEEGETPEVAARREFVEEVGCPVPDGEITNGWRSPNGVYQGFVLTVPVEAEAFEILNPEQPDIPNPDDPERRNPDVSAWFTIDQIMNLGPALRPECREMDWSVFETEEKQMPETDESMVASFETWAEEQIESTPDEAPTDDEAPDGVEPPPPSDVELQWHSVWTVEGTWTGDRRKFEAGSMRARPLPLPISWQKISDDGHKGNVVVGKTVKVARVGNEIRAHGPFIGNAEADEAAGLIAEFGRFGISVDADDATVSMSEEDAAEGTVFTSARAAGACIVPIPAFHQAWIAVGPPPEDFYDGAEDLEVDVYDGETEEALVASAFTPEQLADIAPGRTEDGPGWLTHPVDTDRLRDYWVRGPGAAKIGWGTPNDFYRCRLNVAEYVKPQHLNGYCANRHYDALGYWPGQAPHAGEVATMVNGTPAEALSLVASGGIKAPHEWFSVPEPPGRMPLTIVEDEETGFTQVFGHVAYWGVCHLRWGDKKCVEPPRSPSNYAYFNLGEVLTDQGTALVGPLTIGGGHAPERMRMREAMAHYDDASTVWADVHAVDGEHGIWVCGWVRPGTSPEMVVAARASKLSGDWRRTPAGLDMIVAHSVNGPGFPAVRVAASYDAQGPVSLVAANIVEEQDEDAIDERINYSALARIVADEIEHRSFQRQQAAAEMRALREMAALGAEEI